MDILEQKPVVTGLEKPFVIGLDLGGTNAVFGVVDQRGQVLATNSIKTQAYKTVDDFVEAGVEAIKPLVAKYGGIGQFRAMGIGAPNGNFYRGTIEFAPNLSWGHDGVVPLGDMFSQKLGIPVGLTNDANAAAIGEMQYGVARGMKDFIMITLGTGVGSGIVINGQMVYGSDGFAGELGHVIMVRGEKGRTCGCGRTGCLETYCSATGVARTAREFLQNSKEDSLLREIKPEDITFATFSSPEAFIFFGGLTKAGDLLMEPIMRSYKEHALEIFKEKPKFLISSLDDAAAAVLGASAIGWEL